MILKKFIDKAICHLYYARRFQSWGIRSTIVKPDLLNNPQGISIGMEVQIGKGARLEAVGWSASKPGPQIQIGNWTSIQYYFHCGAVESVTIGNYVLIAGRVFISDHDHEFNHPEKPAIRSGLHVAPVVIEDGVWIGEGAAILKGVRIGQRSVIGANAVVTKDIPPYSVAAGVPARVIKTLKNTDNLP